MSAVIKTVTAFLERELLLQALSNANIDVQVTTVRLQERIQILSHGQYFTYEDGRYKLVYDTDFPFLNFSQRARNQNAWRNAADFLKTVELHYNRLFDARLAELQRLQQEAELQRMEEERRQYVQRQRDAIIQKAKEQGYEVKEKVIGAKIQLVLVKHTY